MTKPLKFRATRRYLIEAWKVVEKEDLIMRKFELR